MIGLGVGIDYGLFLTARYRQELVHTTDHKLAAVRAMRSTGTAVLFSGIVVCLATAGLALAGIPYVTMLGLCAGLAVLVMLVAALTLLPALWGLAGDRIHPHDLDGANSVFARLSRHVSAHPFRYLTAGSAVVLLLAVPLLSIKFGFPSDAAAPAGSTEQRAYDLVAEQLGPGANGPLIVVVQIPPRHHAAPRGQRRRRQPADRRRRPAPLAGAQPHEGRRARVDPDPERPVHRGDLARAAERRAGVGGDRGARRSGSATRRSRTRSSTRRSSRTPTSAARPRRSWT